MIDYIQLYDDNLLIPITTTCHHERLMMQNIYTLQRRWERYAIMYIYKIVIQLVPNPGLEIHYNFGTKIKVTQNKTCAVHHQSE